MVQRSGSSAARTGPGGSAAGSAGNSGAGVPSASPSATLVGVVASATHKARWGVVWPASQERAALIVSGSDWPQIDVQ